MSIAQWNGVRRRAGGRARSCLWVSFFCLRVRDQVVVGSELFWDTTGRQERETCR
jgi:hypothetical protein